MRLTFSPQSLFTWNYWVAEQDVIGAIEFNVGKDSGQIVLGSTAYAIQQDSQSGEWRLLANNTVQASACRFGSNTHSFEVTYGHQRLSLRSGRFGGTALTIHRQDGTLLGDIRPNSFVNRKAKLHCSPEIGVLIQLFLFWLTALMWRRTSHLHAYFRSGC
ncbi:hypothetical protein [Acaryochloris sp. CCMEE 5410]|uniref:hypothetical protein n=1 Tax=Acaryochloris sp. CCMEE 5410 TaxID=310037 RepID=UPI0002484F9B|nr:hypothetical protein [Acaryochloris sp. CCMEE 5410]KAI9133574.1 hypothetical protein ON05_009855 [Acaryochloris sp. CCMEE 5410]